MSDLIKTDIRDIPCYRHMTPHHAQESLHMAQVDTGAEFMNAMNKAKAFIAAVWMVRHGHTESLNLLLVATILTMDEDACLMVHPVLLHEM